MNQPANNSSIHSITQRSSSIHSSIYIENSFTSTLTSNLSLFLYLTTKQTTIISFMIPPNKKPRNPEQPKNRKYHLTSLKS